MTINSKKWESGAFNVFVVGLLIALGGALSMEFSLTVRGFIMTLGGSGLAIIGFAMK